MWNPSTTVDVDGLVDMSRSHRRLFQVKIVSPVNVAPKSGRSAKAELPIPADVLAAVDEVLAAARKRSDHARMSATFAPDAGDTARDLAKYFARAFTAKGLVGRNETDYGFAYASVSYDRKANTVKVSAKIR